MNLLCRPYFLTAPLWLWSCFLGGYLLFAAGMHLRRKRLPYRGRNRWLVFPDLVAVTLIDCSSCLPTAVPIALRYLQTGLLFADRRQKSPRFFLPLYWTMLAFSFLIPEIESGRDLPAAVLCVFFHLGATLILARLLSSSPQETDLELEDLWKQIAAGQRFTATLVRLKEDVVRQMSVCWNLLADITRPSAVEKLSRNLPWYQQVREALEMQMLLLRDVESALDLRALASQKEDVIKFAPFLERYFRAAFFQLSAERELSSETRCPALQVHFLDPSLSHLKIRGAIFWQWAIYCWLRYLLAGGDEKKTLQILISRGQDRDCALKGVARLRVQESSYRMEGARCPSCSRHVRNLYRTHELRESLCRDCLKGTVEDRLKRDWQIASGAVPETISLAIWLIHHLQLGHIQEGTQNWEEWEYFVTLYLRSNLE